MQQKFQGLKKEFKRKDVERVCNLVQGKVNSSSESQVGYTKKQVDHKEGDVWVEKRKTWTIKNGIKQTVSKLDAIKKEIFIPLCCPECSKVMKHNLDKNNYRIHKTCHDCIIKFEHKLQIEGKHRDYLIELERKNNIDILEETESYLLSVVNETNNGYVSEQGDVERWKGGIDKKKMTKEIKQIAKLRRETLNKELND